MPVKLKREFGQLMAAEMLENRYDNDSKRRLTVLEKTNFSPRSLNHTFGADGRVQCKPSKSSVRNHVNIYGVTTALLNYVPHNIKQKPFFYFPLA